MVKYKSYVNTQSMLLLLFVTLSAIIIGVSYHKMKHIEKFENNTKFLQIDYYYTPTCSTCKKFEQNHLIQLKSNDYLLPYIKSGNIKISKYNVAQRLLRKEFMSRMREKERKKVPALFIYENGKKGVQYTGELSSASIYNYIQKNHPSFLKKDEMVITPISPNPEIQPPTQTKPPTRPPYKPPIKYPIQKPPTQIKPPTRPPYNPPTRPPQISLPSPEPIDYSDDIYKCKIDSQDKLLSNYFSRQKNMKETVFNLVKKMDDDTIKLESELTRINNKCKNTNTLH